MLIHLWEDGAIPCHPSEPVVQSTSDLDRVTCPLCRPVVPVPDNFTRIKQAVEDFAKKPPELKTIKIDSYLGFDEFNFEKPDRCTRCKGSGIDPEYCEYDRITGEPVPIACEACDSFWDEDPLDRSV